MNIELDIKSEVNEGTTIILKFRNKFSNNNSLNKQNIFDTTTSSSKSRFSIFKSQCNQDHMKHLSLAFNNESTPLNLLTNKVKFKPSFINLIAKSKGYNSFLFPSNTSNLDGKKVYKTKSFFNSSFPTKINEELNLDYNDSFCLEKEDKTNNNIESSIKDIQKLDSEIDCQVDECNLPEEENRLSFDKKYHFFNSSINANKDSKHSKDDSKTTSDIADNKANICTDKILYKTNNNSFKFVNKKEFMTPEISKKEMRDKKSFLMTEKKQVIFNLDKKNSKDSSSPPPQLQKKSFSSNVLHKPEEDVSYILFSDDDPLVRKSTEKLINSAIKELSLQDNFKVIIGEDGIDTLNTIIKSSNIHKIKLIISDENMKYINGSKSFEILNRLIGERKIPDIPMLIYTCLSNDADLLNIKRQLTVVK